MLEKISTVLVQKFGKYTVIYAKVQIYRGSCLACFEIIKY